LRLCGIEIAHAKAQTEVMAMKKEPKKKKM
jgi:hypothetical protein